MRESVQLTLTLSLYVTETTANVFVVGTFAETANLKHRASRAGIRRLHSSCSIWACGGRAEIGGQAACEQPGAEPAPAATHWTWANDEGVGEVYELFMDHFAEWADQSLTGGSSE